MTPQDYLATQVALVAAAKTVGKLDLPAFLADLAHAETLTPMLDPTLYRQGAVRLDRVKRLARAAMVLRGELLAQIREELGGVAEAAGLGDDEVAALVAPADEAGSGVEDATERHSLPDLGIPPARRAISASDPAPPAGHETDPGVEGSLS